MPAEIPVHPQARQASLAICPLAPVFLPRKPPRTASCEHPELRTVSTQAAGETVARHRGGLSGW